MDNQPLGEVDSHCSSLCVQHTLLQYPHLAQMTDSSGMDFKNSFFIRRSVRCEI
jgi:hypothetical protein